MDDAIVDCAVLLEAAAVCVRALQAEPNSVVALAALVGAIVALQEASGVSPEGAARAIERIMTRGGAVR